jgi:hypothetical protein
MELISITAADAGCDANIAATAIATVNPRILLLLVIVITLHVVGYQTKKLFNFLRGYLTNITEEEQLYQGTGCGYLTTMMALL